MRDKKYNIIVHLNPITDDGTEKFSWVLWHDMGTYGEECGSGVADTELEAFNAAYAAYSAIKLNIHGGDNNDC